MIKSNLKPTISLTFINFKYIQVDFYKETKFLGFLFLSTLHVYRIEVYLVFLLSDILSQVSL